MSSGACGERCGLPSAPPSQALDWRPRAALAAWRHMARTATQAHQRRGESDHVAHWMYVVMALDPGAEEWEWALQGPQL